MSIDSIRGENKPKQTYSTVHKVGVRGADSAQPSYSCYGCDVFVCLMINALIEPHTALID